ncbi:MAG: adenosine-specific kinase [Candidatus Thermoplasmatota archaeon]|nr:adenosine-specific kinase [Candidatus Thermoplasmatota archaeon]
MVELRLECVDIDKTDEVNIILGQTHFIKSVEDLYEAMKTAVPVGKFAVAFNEASGACKVRCEGNDAQLQKLATKNQLAIGAGHTFLIMMRDCYPVNVLNAIKNVPEVCSVFCATANPVKVIVAEAHYGQGVGRGILGVIDGSVPKGVETADDITWRKTFLRQIGYKL